MVRIKKGVTARKHRRHLLKYAKGFRWGRKSKFRAAKDALRHAWEYAYRDRKANKREKRALWQVQINAACRAEGMSYSKFIHALKQKNIDLDRKILSDLARNQSDIFTEIIEKIKS